MQKEVMPRRQSSYLSIKYQPFYEADIGNQLTAIATKPIYGENRRHFQKYNLLRF